MKNPVLKYAALNSVGTALYIALIVCFFTMAPYILGENVEDTFLIPVAMLLLFVLSASVTGSLVLGRPILWYLDGKKKEAVSLLVATLGFLFVITASVFVTMALIAR